MTSNFPVQQLEADAGRCTEIALGYSDDPQLAAIALELAADMKRATEVAPFWLRKRSIFICVKLVRSFKEKMKFWQ